MMVIGTMLCAITSSLPVFAGKNAMNATDVFYNGLAGVANYRIPAVVRDAEGSLHAFAEARHGSHFSGHVFLIRTIQWRTHGQAGHGLLYRHLTRHTFMITEHPAVHLKGTHKGSLKGCSDPHETQGQAHNCARKAAWEPPRGARGPQRLTPHAHTNT